METSHASTLPFTGSLHSIQIISGTSKNILEKEHVLRNRFYDISFTLIADLVLLRNFWYSECFTKG